MKVGYTPMEAYNLFRTLRREVFDFFDYREPVTFGVRSPQTGLFAHGDIAHTDFSADPEKPSGWLETILPHASGIRFNAEFLPHLYEDEMICILLHELCHVTAGWCNGDGHGDRWQRMAREVGTIPHPVFLIRNWANVFSEGTMDWHWAKAQAGPTIEVFAGSL